MTHELTPYQAAGYRNSHSSRNLMVSIHHVNIDFHEKNAPCFAEMEGLALSAMDVPTLMCDKPRWNSLKTLHPFCDWERWDVNIASRISLFHNKPCVYYEASPFKLDMRRKNSICTYPGVLERLVFAGESSLYGLWGRVNLANSWGRTWF